jgi:hypothetical protein
MTPEKRENVLLPIVPLFLQVIGRINSASNPVERLSEGLRLLHDDNPIAKNDEHEFVARLHTERFAGFARNDNLVFRR